MDINKLSGSSRVWVYQSSQPFKESDLPTIRQHIKQFVQQWVSHNRQLLAFGDIVENRFVVLMVDESQADASGCSIDSSVHFLKQLEQAYGVNLFDRLHFSYQLPDQTVHTVSKEVFEEKFANGEINDDTLVFDTLVKTKTEFESGFLKPLSESWHKRLV